jgi:hypothetical protein
MENRRCPACGKVVRDQKTFSISGHIRGIEMGKTLFACCREHRNEAESALKRKKKHNSDDGYLGQWEERLGLVAEIEDGDLQHKIVVILEGSEK